MGTTMKGWLELDTMRLIRVKSFEFNGGRPKAKVIPAGSNIAVDTNYGPRSLSGTMTIYGTEEDGFEFDWRTACNTKQKFDAVRHFSAADRIGLREIEFSTFGVPLPSGEDELEITLDWVATEDVAA